MQLKSDFLNTLFLELDPLHKIPPRKVHIWVFSVDQPTHKVKFTIVSSYYFFDIFLANGFAFIQIFGTEGRAATRFHLEDLEIFPCMKLQQIQCTFAGSHKDDFFLSLKICFLQSVLHAALALM